MCSPAMMVRLAIHFSKHEYVLIKMPSEKMECHILNRISGCYSN
jgi:hypothetical protein